MADLRPKGSEILDAIIALAISAIGHVFCGIDFCMLYTFVSSAIVLYRNWIDYTNDKTAKR